MAMGMEMLMQTMLKGMGVKPELVMEQITQFVSIAKNADATLARIEAKQDLILALLDNAETVKTIEHHSANGASDHG